MHLFMRVSPISRIIITLQSLHRSVTESVRFTVLHAARRERRTTPFS